MTDEPRETTEEGVTKKAISRRQFLKYAALAGATIGAGASLGGLIAACGDETTTTTSVAGPTTTAGGPATTAGGPATTVATGSSTGEVKELLIGVNQNTSTDVGIDSLNAITMVSDNMNAAGGVNVGGQQYKIKVISYDSKNSQAGETEAANRLIYQDKAKYIISQGQYQAAWTPIADKEKVLVLTQAIDPASYNGPDVKYTFCTTASNPGIQVAAGWFCAKMPDAVKSPLIVASDDPFGHMASEMFTGQLAAFGSTAKIEFFPPTSVDFSSLATKVLSLNPSCVTPLTGNGLLDGQVLGAIRAAGSQAVFFMPTKNSGYMLLQYMSAKDLEGLISGCTPFDFDPCPTPAAQEFKDAWIAKFGKYTGSSPLSIVSLYALIAALEKAGSLDTDTLAGLLANGMEWESPFGHCQMIPELQLGGTRTSESISATYMKTMKNGQSVLLATVDIAEGEGYYRKAFGN